MIFELSGVNPTECLLVGRCYPSATFDLTGAADFIAPIDVTQDDQVESLLECSSLLRPWLIVLYDTNSSILELCSQ